MRLVLLTLLSLLCCFTVHAQSSIEGDWEGAIHIQGQKLKIVFHIQGAPGKYSGTLDIPQQGAMGLPLTRAEQKTDSVYFRFFTGQDNGDFAGIMESGDVIRGNYRQGTATFPFNIEKLKPTQKSEKIIGKGKELIIPAGTVEVGGTLVTPENTEHPPLVIMISGSGAQDRNSDVFGFKIFAEMAEFLKNQGISSFRYDDRQVGSSTGSFSDATLNMLANDVHAIIDYLKNLENESFSEIILIGHSQGGVVAGKVANEDPEVDKLILMASTGVSLKEVLRFQVKQAYGEGIHTKQAVKKEIMLREDLMAAIRDEENVEIAKQNYSKQYRSMIEALPESQKAGIPDIDAFVKKQADQLAAVYGSPQMKSLLFYDPTEDLKELDIPVLVLFGGKDTQVTEEQNRKPIEEALKSSSSTYEVEILANANHLFQHAESGQVSEYALLKKEFVEGFLEKITQWIHEK